MSEDFPSQLYDDVIPESKRNEVCWNCGHTRREHYKGRGMCEYSGHYGGICLCNRFKKCTAKEYNDKLKKLGIEY